MRSLSKTRNLPKTWYALVIPASISFPPRTKPIPGSWETRFCFMGLLTKSMCCLEEPLIIPREKKNQPNDVKRFTTTNRSIFPFFWSRYRSVTRPEKCRPPKGQVISLHVIGIYSTASLALVHTIGSNNGFWYSNGLNFIGHKFLIKLE